MLLCIDTNFRQYLGAFSDETGNLSHVIYQRLCTCTCTYSVCITELIAVSLQLQAQATLESYADALWMENARSRVRVEQRFSLIRAVEITLFVCLRSSYNHVTEVRGR